MRLICGLLALCVFTFTAFADDCPKEPEFPLIERLWEHTSDAMEKVDSYYTPRQILTMQQLTSIYENGTTDFQYGYIEDIGDGAGVTCGTAGFTGKELNIIVSRYLKAEKGNTGLKTALSDYIPCLKRIGHQKDLTDYGCLYPSLNKEQMNLPDFKKEGGGIEKTDFGKLWVEASNDPVMKKIQRDYVKEVYLDPALRGARHFGLRTALGSALIYDSYIQMGHDGSEMVAAITKTKFAKTHEGRKTPGTLSEEIDWLKIYQQQRKVELSKTTVGASTVIRVDSLDQILAAGNLDLWLPIHITYGSNSFEVK